MCAHTCIRPCSFVGFHMAIKTVFRLWMEGGAETGRQGQGGKRGESKTRGGEEERETSRELRDEGRDFSSKFDWRRYSKP